MNTDTQRPTPETENNLFEITTRDMLGRPTGTKEYTHADFARKLERERNAAREALSGRTVSCSQCNEAAKQLEAMREAIKEAEALLVAVDNGAQQDIHGVNWYDRRKLTLSKLQPHLKP